MHSIQSAPPEVLIQIFQNCNDFPDVLALATTCKLLHSVWLASPGSILWLVGKRIIIAFSDALIAVRATAIVKAASQRGALPPHPFPLLELSGNYLKPSIVELQAVLDLRHMMRCMQEQLLYWKRQRNEFYRESSSTDVGDLMEDGWEEWEGNFFRSMYRVVIAGAMFTRAYMEPFVTAARNKDDGFFDRFIFQPAWLKLRDNEWPHLTGDDLENITRYPVYNFGADEESEEGIQRDQDAEAIFGPFAEWMIEDGKKREFYHVDGLGDGGYSNEICDSMRLLAAYKQYVNCLSQSCKMSSKPADKVFGLATKLANFDGGYHHGRGSINEGDSVSWGRVRKVSVVLFGIFQVEEITMPACTEDARKMFLIAEPTFKILRYPDIYPFLSRISFALQQPNYHDGQPAPPGMLQFFVFALRKYFNLRLSEDNFEPVTESNFEDLEHFTFLTLAEPLIFSPGECGYGVLREYTPPSRTWQ